jgi:hypothetical protein
MCRAGATVCLLGLFAWAVPQSQAAFVTYTFESPEFTAGQFTPLLNKAPNVGSSAFRADFTSSPNSGGFQILNFQPNSLFSGNSLVAPGGSFDTLTITVNTPVQSVSFDFGMNLSPTGNPGQMRLISPVGTQNQNGGNVGGSFQGGTLTFNSATPFTTFQLQAFNSAGNRVEFAIDDLTLTLAEPTAVPVPGSIVLAFMGLGLGGPLVRKLRKTAGETAASA